MTPPARRGTRIAHIGIAVRGLDAILPFYRDILGLPEVPRVGAEGKRIAFLHPKSTGGVLIELCEY